MNCKQEILKGLCIGLGQSIAGILILTIFGKKIYKYMIKSCKELDDQLKTEKTNENPDLYMQKLYNETVKDKQTSSEECLLSDGETIKIKPKIILKKL